jgi:hypothetical protein
MMVSLEGKKQFRTTMTVSYGIDKRSSKDGPVYTSMEHTQVSSAIKEDYDNEHILPGIGESQALPGRKDGELVKDTISPSYTPNKLRKKREKNRESNTGEDKK